MDLTLDDDQLLLAESARQLFERTYTTESARAAEATPDGFSSDLWKQARELGWPGIALPEDCGGAGYGALELAVLAEELGRGAATLPLLPSYSATLPLLWAAGATLRARWMEPLATGEAIAALALTDPQRQRLEVTTADGWTISGTKLAVPFGAVADVLVVPADLDSGGAPSLVAVAADAPGVARARHDTFAPTPYASVTFTDVSVGRDDVVGDAALLERALAHQTVVDTAYAVGLAGGALALAVDHASNREQFGRPIGVNQAVSHQCVDMRVEIDAMRVLALQAAWRLDRYDADSAGAERAVALANAYARDVLPGIFARAHQVHGAIGFTLEYDLQLYTRRAKAYELTGGGAAHHFERVARAIGL
jgi:alkylation response protein AidB-like acyl-CoA dehydrogenase